MPASCIASIHSIYHDAYARLVYMYRIDPYHDAYARLVYITIHLISYHELRDTVAV